MTTRSILALAATLLLAAPAAAEYRIDWYTIDSGGGTSSGGSYQLSGTIGQPDAGRASGGDFELVGGFWAVTLGTIPPSGEVESDYFYIGSPIEDAQDIEVAQSIATDDWALF
jgi:hypothetical protein